MLIAAAQIQSSRVPAENLIKAKTALQEATNRGAKLVVFPEIFMALIAPDDFKPEIVRGRSQPLDGPFVSSLGDLARTFGTWIVAGVLETAEDDKRAYNTTVIFDDTGHLIRFYRKTHLFDAFGFQESAIFAPGDALFEPLDSPFGRIGLFVCYELRFPEVARYQAERGAELLVMPAGWVRNPQPLKEQQWRHLTIARAIENTAYMVACDQVGNQFLGYSMCVDPMGAVLSEGSEVEDIIYADIDLQRVQEVRNKVPSIAHRRTELYTPIPAHLSGRL